MSTVILSTGAPADVVVELYAGRPFSLRIQPRAAHAERTPYDVVTGFMFGDREFDTENYRIARFGPDLVFADGARFELRFLAGEASVDVWAATIVDNDHADLLIPAARVATVRAAAEGARVEWWLVEPGQDDYLIGAGEVRAL